MANWKNKQVAFDLDNPEEFTLHQFARSILFTPIMKACLRLIKSGILKVSWSKDGIIQIGWNEPQQHTSQIHVPIPLPAIRESAATRITQSDADIDDFCL